MKSFVKRSISLLLVSVLLVGSAPIFQILGIESLEKFDWSTIKASAASVITMTTGDENFSDNKTWLDVDSDRVSWTCSTTSVKSYRYTVREMTKSGAETSNVLVDRKLTTSKYFKLSSLSGINAASCYKVWVGAFTDTSGNTGLVGDPGCVVYIRTMSEAPTVTSGKASSIGATYATLSGTIEKNGGESITECGFVVSTSKSNLTTSKGTVFKLDKTGDIKGTFSKKVTDLSPLAIHTYYFKFYAKNSEGTSYGDAVSFKLVCPHTNKDDKIVIETLSYKSISETQHERSAYYDEYCTLCCATLRYEYRHDTIKENHDYNAAGICLDCKHAKACPHEEQSKEYYTETYNCIDETYHYYNHFYKLVCDDCGIDVDTKVMWDEIKQKHTFSNNTCAKCGYTKNQELSVTLTADSTTANINTNIGATAKAVGGAGDYTYAYKVYDENGKQLDSMTSAGVTRYSYLATEVGEYYFKVTVTDKDGNTASATSAMISVVCPHETYDISKFDITSTEEYEQYNETQHYKIWYYNHRCTVCDTLFKEHVTDEENRKLENHSYATNSNSCRLCGYKNTTTYTVSYDANGGIGAPASQTKQYNITLKLSAVIPSKKGYNFLGWSTSATATSATYSAGGNYTQNSNCTLYAVWSLAVPKVIINGTEIAPEYLRKEQTGVYAELYKLTSALNGSYTKNGNNATVKLYSEYYGEYLYFDYKLPANLSDGKTFNVTVRNETNTLNFLAYGVYADGMIYGNVDLLAKAGNMQRSPDYDPNNNCEYIGAFIKNSKLLDKKSTVSFVLGDVPGTTTISFEQGWLINDSKIYNHALAQFCSQFSMLGYEDDSYGKAVGVSSKTQLKTALESVGFQLVDINMQTGRDEVNYFIATRQGMDLKTGKVYDVIFVGLIGSFKDQWYSDFDPWGIDRKKILSNETKDKMHQGFLDAKNYVYTNLFEYMRGKYGENFSKHNIKIILTGHSRGAAAANLLGKQLIDNNLYTKKENIFTYAFATPRSVIDPNATSETYSRLFNVVNPEDFVTKVMPEKWGFDRYGTTLVLPSKTNDTLYNSYLKAMNVKYATLKEREEYKPYKSGEEETYNVTQKFSSFDIFEFYYGFNLEYIDNVLKDDLNDNAYRNIPFYFFKQTLCKYLANDRNWVHGIDMLNKIDISTQILKEIGKYFLMGDSLLGDDILPNGTYFTHAHQMETYCAYMLSMTEEQLTQVEREGYKGSVNCPVDVDIYDKETGKLVGRIKNNIVDETVAAKENAVVMTVNGDSKSFWLPSNGDYKVVLTGNDDGTMDYIVRNIDSDSGETERINYFDVEVVKGASMRSETSSENFTIDDYVLKDESGTTIEATEKLVEEDLLSLEIKISAEGDGFASSDQTVTKGDYVTLDATPNGLNLFIGWYNEKGELVSSEQNYSFVAKDNVSLVARFTTIKSFSVSKLPIKAEYTYKLDTEVDLAGIELEITYTDGTKQTVTDTSKMTASGYSAKPRGEKTITVEYEGLKADFKVKVKYTWWQWIIIILLGGWIWY